MRTRYQNVSKDVGRYGPDVEVVLQTDLNVHRTVKSRLIAFAPLNVRKSDGVRAHQSTINLVLGLAVHF